MRMLTAMAIVALAACSSARSDDNAGFSVSDNVGDWSATLEPRNNSSVRGTAGAQSALAATAVRISINGATSGGHHPWHVHLGECGSGGTIVGDVNAYPALHVGADGTASVTTSIPVPLNENQRYHVNVHRSVTEMGVVLSCGNLRN